MGCVPFLDGGMSQKKTTADRAKAPKKNLGPFVDLGPPPNVPPVDDVRVLERTFATLLPGQVVELEDGYDVHSSHGLLSRAPGPSNRLLCLVDVFEWMRRKELPRKAVVHAVFDPLVQLDEADEPHRRQELYVVNGEDYAHPLSLGEHLNPKARVVWGQLDFAYQDTYSMGAAREIAELWDASWPGYVCDPGQFYQQGWIQHCKNMKRVARLNCGPRDWEEEYRSRYYLSLEEWKERCKSAVRLLSRLAVPLSVAHELWGWGRIVEVVPQVKAVADTTPALVIEAQCVTDWPSLVQYRSQFASLAAQKRPVWQPEHVALLAWRLHEEHQAGRGRGALARLASELGAVRSTLGERLIKHGYSSATGEKQQAPVTPWSGMGGRGVKAA